MKESPPSYGITPAAFLGFGALIVLGVAIVVPVVVRLVSSWIP